MGFGRALPSGLAGFIALCALFTLYGAPGQQRAARLVLISCELQRMKSIA